ncbi:MULTISPECIES: RagB/SusD family nutrient uptake outer membrane protein [Maribacter]|uniref:RagB/SusD family nutrient uptake outer membrane protein n=1 Tax=Maribacter TaxID=252356 RepID=UPI000C088C51|nr:MULTISPECIES: RagB/SusD family nutrient uptake outer membrane protein [unclassified Maribacter]PHN94225.1 RagB/SusD family nutrient uptake outer membrane protein [Maribacter sp. 6B07]HAF77002.1 RagB/SusD family nutrient uptake outer membrane protein [Maribacter sp.]|tara:strand:+ start:46485 stop:48242 length:1758 start_codon:yes stop_codon:yes gene_type:complete
MKNKLIISSLVLVSLLTWSCTDLEEELLDESLTGAQAEVISGAIAPAYGYISWTWRHTNYYGLQLIPSDEAILPYRGGTDWFDGGKFLAAHSHNFTPTNDLVASGWNELTTNISRTLAAIEVLTPLADEGDAEAAGALYEMKALRAYLNMLLLDSWGIVLKKESSEELSEVLRTQDAIDYIESELLSVVDVINDDKGPGRMSRSAVYGFLARLNLNAAVYRDPYGTPNFTQADMDQVITYTSNIIDSGNFSLSPEYFELFNDENHSNPELIFALDQRGVLTQEHSRWAYWSIAGSMFPRPEWPSADGTDGPAVTSDFYQTWVDAYGDVDPADADARFYQKNTLVPDAQLADLEGREKLLETETEDSFYCVQDVAFEMDRGILRGIQWGPRKGDDGQFLTCEDGTIKILPVRQIKGNGPSRDIGYVDHTLEIDFTNEGSLHNTGYRASKYQFSRTSPNGNGNSSVDLVLMRLAEVYLMRAEAKLRNGDAAGALADVNVVRTSRTARPEQTPDPLTAVDTDILFRERGFELYWEGFRRGDQIRFGKYEDTWTEKTDTDVNHRLFPIPQSAVDGASGIDGFLEQNPGY